jgi:hypothetical protein
MARLAKIGDPTMWREIAAGIDQNVVEVHVAMEHTHRMHVSLMVGAP